jgi:predicted transcriptional regulator
MSQSAARMAWEALSPARESGTAKQRSVLELAPLELACMNALWPLGEASVREIRASMSESRPRAYTTIMTIMDRLAHKGIVERQRAGRAWRYRPNLTAEDARTHAIAQVVEGFFGGSAAALADQLRGHKATPPAPPESPIAERTAVAGRQAQETTSNRAAAPPAPAASKSRIDETLL